MSLYGNIKGAGRKALPPEIKRNKKVIYVNYAEALKIDELIKNLRSI